MQLPALHTVLQKNLGCDWTLPVKTRVMTLRFMYYIQKGC